jgi:hypothetical protein
MAHPAKSQNSLSQKPCNDPKSSEFDFWIGNWSLTWNDTSKGTNSVNRVLDGCVVQENFSDPVQQFTGSSWSVYNPQTALWQQTWVDNQGGYIVLTGKFEKGEMILSTAPVTLKNGKQSVSRMIYYNIQRGSFDWSWENTTDNGNTWKLNWKIHYQRK